MITRSVFVMPPAVAENDRETDVEAKDESAVNKVRVRVLKSIQVELAISVNSENVSVA